MKTPSANFYQMPNAIFHYGLTPDQFTVYSYLLSAAGQKEKCWPSIKTIAKRCRLSENTVRKAVKVLEQRNFIRKVESKRKGSKGQWLQTNNHYFILELPRLASPPEPEPPQEFPAAG